MPVVANKCKFMKTKLFAPNIGNIIDNIKRETASINFDKEVVPSVVEKNAVVSVGVNWDWQLIYNFL